MGVGMLAATGVEGGTHGGSEGPVIMGAHTGRGVAGQGVRLNGGHGLGWGQGLTGIGSPGAGVLLGAAAAAKVKPAKFKPTQTHR